MSADLALGVPKKPPRPWWFRVGRVSLVGYVGVILMLLALENSLVYHPVRASDEWVPAPDPRTQDVELVSSARARIHAWWLPHGRPRGALLYCHGNAGNLSHRGEAVMEWHRGLELSVLIFDYPGYGRSGGKPSEAGCYAAGDAAYDWLTKQAGVPAEEVILYGGSLGGGVAVDLASRRPHRALVLCAAFSSLPELAQELYPWLPARWLVRNRFDNLAKIARCHRPVFIAHGDCDTLIDGAHAERLFAAANEPKRYFVMEGHGHYESADEPFFAALRQFLDENAPCLKSK
jgi:fermentation-respiration switch protein FrsA (DUF1100 family)